MPVWLLDRYDTIHGMRPPLRTARDERAASRMSLAPFLFESFGLLLSLFLVFPVVSCAEGHLFQDEKLGISFLVPEGWSEDTGLVTKSSFVAFAHNSKIVSSIISLLGPRSLPWYQLRFSLLDYAKSQAPMIQVVAGAKVVPQPERTQLRGREAVVTTSEGSVGGLTTVVIDYCFLDSRRKRVYHLRFNSSRIPFPSSVEVFNADKSAFLTSVESFTIH